MLPKVQVRPKSPPFGFFFGTMRLFSKIFEIYQRVPPCIFLKFSVCRKRWMSLNGLFLSFSALCDLKNTFFRKKNFKNNFFEKFFFQIFPIVVPWIFLSLRYGADLGRSRLVCFSIELGVLGMTKNSSLCFLPSTPRKILLGKLSIFSQQIYIGDVEVWKAEFVSVRVYLRLTLMLTE